METINYSLLTLGQAGKAVYELINHDRENSHNKVVNHIKNQDPRLISCLSPNRTIQATKL
jgi:hypothetical protein